MSRRRYVDALESAANAIDSLQADEPGCGCASCEENARIPKLLRKLAAILGKPRQSEGADA